ncbi:MAG: acyltransferase family protein [Clostridiales bacterium]|nr:acyltransferase family protein [Clostridiales bacterium]
MDGKSNLIERSRAERIEWLDEIKGILIVLVVLGHTLAGQRAQNMDMFGILHYLIYSVHMPMFMLISGYLSKKQISIKKAIKDYLIPYIFFDLLYIIWEALRGIDVSLNILFPTYVYWSL